MATATIDELEIQIEADGNDASAAIDRLTQSLERLVNPVSTLTSSGSGLSKLSKQMEKLSASVAGIQNLTGFEKVTQAVNALKSLDSLTGAADVSSYVKAINKLAGAGASLTAIAQFPDVTAQLSSLAGALNSLQGVQGIRLDGITNSLSQLPQIIAAINSMPAIDTARIQALDNALTPLSGVNAGGISSFVRALSRIPAAAQQINRIDFTQFSQNVQQLTNSLQPLVDAAERAGDGLTAMAQIMQATQRNVNNMGQTENILGKFMKSLFSWAALVKLKNALVECFEASSQFVENLNLFNVTMGKSADTAMDFAVKVNDALGVDISDWTRYQGFFQSVGKGFGVVSEKADLMSKNLTQLTYDISSFYNVSVNDAYLKVQAGFAGELEPLRRLGFALDEATLKQVAFNHGITQSFESMTQAQKSQLRYVAMIEQAKNIGVTGDMSRTIDTAANGVRVLQARVQQFARAVGNMLMPALSAILPYLTAFIQVVTEGANALADLFGFELPKINLDGITNGYDDITAATEEATAATEKFKGSLAGVDQLNIIGSKNTTGGTGANQYDLNIDLPEYDFLNGVESKTKQIAEDMKQWFMDALPWIEAVGTALAGFTISQGLINGIKALGTLKTAMAGLSSKIAPVSIALAAGAAAGTLLYSSIKNLITGTGNLGNNIAQLVVGIGIAGGAIAAFIAFGNPIGAIITAVGALIGVFAGVSAAIKESDEQLAEWQQAMADTIVYADNGGISITGLSDGFTDYFNNIADNYDDILANTQAFDDNQQKIKAAADEIYNLTGKYSLLSDTITAEDAQTISDNLAIIEKGVSDNLGLATQNIIDTLKTKFHELALQMGIDIDDMMGKFYLLESMGNTSLATLRQSADEIVAKITGGNYTTEDLTELNNIVRKISSADTGTVEQKSFEQALKNMTSADIDFESPEALTEALNQVQSAADNALSSVKEAWASQAKQLDDLQATYVNLGVDIEYDKTFGDGAFDKLFTEYRNVMDTGYQQEINNINNSVGAYAGMLYSKLNEHINTAVSGYIQPTNGELYGTLFEEYGKHGWLTNPYEVESIAEGKAEERIRSGYKDQIDSITQFASNFDIDSLSEYEKIGNYLLDGMANGVIENSGDLSEALTIASKGGIDALKQYLGIHSPSTVFAEIGGFMMEGWKNGISDNVNSVLAVIDMAAVEMVARVAKIKKDLEQNNFGDISISGESSFFPQVTLPSTTGTEPGFASRNISDMISENRYGGSEDKEITVNLQNYTVVEMDGESVGEAMANKQIRQVMVTNGR